MNYYNEYDPKAAAWIQELINQKLIPDGIVDQRSICDVRADDLREFTQCHFFAGIAGWSKALQLAGVDPDERLWTGSCPCQSFSTAGKQKGFDDHRDLWPVFSNLIRECRPPKVFGEQVANAIKFGWLDRVYTDLESAGYAVGAAVIGAHSVGAPHQRQRLYWGAERVSDAADNGHDGSNQRTSGTDGSGEQRRMLKLEGSCDALRLSDTLREQTNGTHSPGLHAGTSGNSTALRISYTTGKRCDRRSDTAEPSRIAGAEHGCPDCRMAEITESVRRRGRSDELPVGMQRQIQAPGLGACGGVPAVSQGDGCGERLQGHRRLEQQSIPQGWQGAQRHDTPTGGASNIPLGNSEIIGLETTRNQSADTLGASSSCDNLAISDTGAERSQGRDTRSESGFRSGLERHISNDSFPSVPWNRYALILCRDRDKDGTLKIRRVPAESVLLGVVDGIPESVDAGGNITACIHSSGVTNALNMSRRWWVFNRGKRLWKTN